MLSVPLVSRRAGRGIAALAVATCALALTVMPAAAMVNGTSDGTRHPEVGMMGTARSDGTFQLACSGALIAPRVFLTAAHCVAATNRRDPSGVIYLWFGPGQQFGSVTTPGVVTGRGSIHPDYRADYRNDIAVVVLDEPYELDAYAALPDTGFLDELQAAGGLGATLFTVVGYGTNEQQVIKKSGPVFYYTGERQYGVLGFNSLTKLWLNETQNIAQGYQGACYGDSGGPTFLGAGDGETDLLLAVTSTGDGPCYATNVGSRTDTPQARSWIQGFLDANAS